MSRRTFTSPSGKTFTFDIDDGTRGATGDAERDDLLATRLELLDIIADLDAEIVRLRRIEATAREVVAAWDAPAYTNLSEMAKSVMPTVTALRSALDPEYWEPGTFEPALDPFIDALIRAATGDLTEARDEIARLREQAEECCPTCEEIAGHRSEKDWQ